jgi:Cu(I)/Ag(I) efflux system periplasmic protein CusF
MKRTHLLSLALVMVLSAPLSQSFADQHDSHHVGSTAMTAGEVKKVDKDAGKVTIKHGRIENLDMPGMTMIFRVKDAAILDQLKEGDKINFAADKVNGTYTLMQVESVK